MCPPGTNGSRIAAMELCSSSESEGGDDTDNVTSSGMPELVSSDGHNSGPVEMARTAPWPNLNAWYTEISGMGGGEYSGRQ